MAAFAFFRYPGACFLRVRFFAKRGVGRIAAFTRRSARARFKTVIAAPKSKSCPTVVLKRMPFCGSFCIVMAAPRTTSIVSFWQAWHSKVGCCQPVPSDAIRVSQIDVRTWGTLDVRCLVMAKWIGPGAWRHPMPSAGGSASGCVSPTPNAPAVDDR
jgi:hypothetical protein